jgi:hypothetical protein
MKSLLTFLFLARNAVGALSQNPASELTSRDLWKPEHVSFSFRYHGKESAQFLTTWQTSEESVAESGEE